MTPMMHAALVLVAKIVVIGFIASGVVALIIRGIVVARANKHDPDLIAHDLRREQGAWGMGGARTPTPLPEWVNWDTEDDEGGDTNKSAGGHQL